MTKDELDREREAAAAKAVEHVIEEEVRPLIKRLRADLRQAAVLRDTIPEDVLLEWLGVSKKTLRQRWKVPHESKRGQTRFYDWETVEDHLRDGDEEQRKALRQA